MPLVILLEVNSNTSVSLLKGYGNNTKQLTQKEFISKISDSHPEYNFSNTLCIKV